MSQEAQERKVVICEPFPDRKKTDKWGNPLDWILIVKYPISMRGKVAFPVGFKVDPTKEEYKVEIVEEKPRYLRVKLHTQHVHGRHLSDVNCCKFECALCGEWFEDCEHPLAKKCIEEERARAEERARFWEGIEYLTNRLMAKMAREIEELKRAIDEMYEAIRSKPSMVAGYRKETREVCLKKECHDAVCPGCWASDEENYCYCIEWGTKEVDVPIPKPEEQYEAELREWREKVKPIAEKLVALLQLFPVKCDALLYCTDSSIVHVDPEGFDPGWIMAALGIDDCTLRSIQNFIVEVLGGEYRGKYYDGELCH
jgi:hypothetical protein